MCLQEPWGKIKSLGGSFSSITWPHPQSKDCHRLGIRDGPYRRLRLIYHWLLGALIFGKVCKDFWGSKRILYFNFSLLLILSFHSFSAVFPLAFFFFFFHLCLHSTNIYRVPVIFQAPSWALGTQRWTRQCPRPPPCGASILFPSHLSLGLVPGSGFSCCVMLCSLRHAYQPFPACWKH